MFWDAEGPDKVLELIVVQLVLVKLPQFNKGKVWGCECVWWGGCINSLYNMFRNDVFCCQFQIPFLGGVWSHWTGKFSDDPSESQESTPSPSHPHQKHHAYHRTLQNEQEGRGKGIQKTTDCILCLGIDTWLPISGQHGLEESGQRLLSSPRGFHGKVGRQCIGERKLGKHATSSSGATQGSLRLGPWCAPSLSWGPNPHFSSSWSIPNPQQLQQPEIFSNKCSFQGGLHSTCMNTVNMVWRSQGSFWACPKYYIFFFPFSGSTSMLYSFIYTQIVFQLHTQLCRVEMPALPNLEPGCVSKSYR